MFAKPLKGSGSDVSEFWVRTGNATSFNLRLQRAEAKTPKPQLVLAVTSPKPLAALATGQPVAADTLFPYVLDEASRTGQPIGVAVKYFTFGG